ncbi:hypothetical protein BpHYR1_035246 [Brachionus plicatilis]|uniref:Uncharacterized protein n=1 Tax=Brachionus plicatilis TaxID=10195 RepID=A0A3M7QTW8_BRAPC|nr:hypothetical protein BpHYR1_035246 [Brachionus plicatilis]
MHAIKKCQIFIRESEDTKGDYPGRPLKIKVRGTTFNNRGTNNFYYYYVGLLIEVSKLRNFFILFDFSPKL